MRKSCFWERLSNNDFVYRTKFNDMSIGVSFLHAPYGCFLLYYWGNCSHKIKVAEASCFSSEAGSGNCLCKNRMRSKENGERL